MQTAKSGVIKPLLCGDVYWVRLDPVEGHEKGKTRPAVIIQNNLINEVSPLVVVAVITSRKIVPKKMRFMVEVDKGEGSLDQDSYVDCAQIRTVDHVRLQGKIGSLSREKMAEVKKAVDFVLDIK
ncbi:MAG TPA: type II toxin-antitoxin system PemK/MazF family toxin [Ignavibacteriales bacterium]|nr:type II toxin-antitoxin system PemK/MazF family toxin [Ignavibacteriales bacterium]